MFSVPRHFVQKNVIGPQRYSWLSRRICQYSGRVALPRHPHFGPVFGPRDLPQSLREQRRLVRGFSSSSQCFQVQEVSEFPVLIVSDEEAEKFVEHAKELWPGPATPAPGWSSNWAKWGPLLSFYHQSAFYLMLPQIEMITNIQYNMRGQTQPLLFSTEPNKPYFIFSMTPPHSSSKGISPKKKTTKKRDDNSASSPTAKEPGVVYYLCNTDTLDMFQLVSIHNEQDLISALEDDVDDIPRRALMEDPDSEDVILRILNRDPTVIDVLAEHYLDYRPRHTERWEENPNWDKQEEESEELPEDLTELFSELEPPKEETPVEAQAATPSASPLDMEPIQFPTKEELAKMTPKEQADALNEMNARTLQRLEALQSSIINILEEATDVASQERLAMGMDGKRRGRTGQRSRDEDGEQNGP